MSKETEPKTVPMVRRSDGKTANVAEAEVENYMTGGYVPDEDAKSKKSTKAKKSKAKKDPEIDFASDEAGEVYAKLVKDKVLEKDEYAEIEGTGENGALTVGDIEDYVAAKNTPPPPPAAAKPKK